MPASHIEFENGHFLHSLFGNDETVLDALQVDGLSLHVRDNQLLVDGDDAQMGQVRALFRDLDSARRKGLEITPNVFKVALSERGEDGGAPLLQELLDSTLLGSSSKPPVVPMTRGQLNYLRAMKDHDFVFGIGSAGTGKTYLAMAKALAALQAGEVNRVILSRPAVEAGEALGFLPGDMQEKLFPYLRPLYDALYDMLEPEVVEKAIDGGQIEIAPLAYMRGRTLARAFVILDEAQNTTTEQMFMFLTRLGMGSRCVITGDPSQVDLQKGARSGLEEALRVLNGVEGIAEIEFEPSEVVRHPVVQRIIEAYEKERKKSA